MSLEDRLVALGDALDVPDAPDLVPAVRARLEPRRRPRRLTPRAVAAAVAVTLALAGGALAVPPVRHAVWRVLGLRGVEVQRVPRLPRPPSGVPRGLDLGRRIAPSAARHAADFRALLPAGPIRAAYVAPTPPGGRISLAAGRLLIVEFRGSAEIFLRKLIGPGTGARRVRVNGGTGVYLSGAPHQVFYTDARGSDRVDAFHLAGNVLLWQQGELIVRIEGARSLREALAVARSLR